MKTFVPTGDSEAVRKLLTVLGTAKTPVSVRVLPAPKAMENCCYQNVSDKVSLVGGNMQLGWAVWQHDSLFIEAEPHAVFDPGNGEPWTDPTPNSFPDGSRCRGVLFIPKDGTRDPNSTVIEDNIRVPLVDDPRVAEALKLSSKRIAVLNSVPKEWTPEGLMYHYPPGALMQIMELEARAGMLLAAAMERSTPSKPPQKIGRNSSCLCGSGQKYKRCCGK